MNPMEKDLQNLKHMATLTFLFTVPYALMAGWPVGPVVFAICVFVGIIALYAYRTISSLHKRVSDLESRIAELESSGPTPKE